MKFLANLAIVAVAGIFACTSSSKNEQYGGAPAIKEGAIQTQEFGSCDTTKGYGASVKMAVWLPSDTTQSALAIRQTLERKIVERINSHNDSASIATNPEASKNAEGAFKVFEKNFVDTRKAVPGAPGCWEINLKGDTLFSSPKVLTYELEHYAYTGGAHPNTFISLHVFDAKTGIEKEASSFVTDQAALLKKVEEAFRKTEKLTPEDNLEQKGYFLPDHKFFIPANYTFTEAGVLFYYNRYEIAAYVKGAIEFTIPYSDLKGIVNMEDVF